MGREPRPGAGSAGPSCATAASSRPSIAARAAAPPGIAASAPRVPLRGEMERSGGSGDGGQGNAPVSCGAWGEARRAELRAAGARRGSGPGSLWGGGRRAAPLSAAFRREVLGSVQKRRRSRGWQKEPRVWSRRLRC